MKTWLTTYYGDSNLFIHLIVFLKNINIFIICIFPTKHVFILRIRNYNVSVNPRHHGGGCQTRLFWTFRLMVFDIRDVFWLSVQPIDFKFRSPQLLHDACKTLNLNIVEGLAHSICFILFFGTKMRYNTRHSIISDFNEFSATWQVQL